MGLFQKKVAIIGNGKVAKECLAIVSACSGELCSLVSVVIDNSRGNITEDLKNYCLRNNINYIVSDNINDHSTIQYLRDREVDVVFSINNHQIIRGELLALPPEGIINFHNGPLPRYGGLNACTWAIFNGETRHGVTWHYVSSGVDDGDIVGQKFFEIKPDITALQLVMVCINEGIALFREIIPSILAGKVKRAKQDPTLRLYYFERMTPENGRINFCWDYNHIDRLVRALNYHPMVSKIGSAHGEFNSRKFFVDKVKLVSRDLIMAPGSVVCAAQVLHIQVQDAIMEIMEIRNERQERMSVNRFIEEYGVKLATLFSADGE
ncbi:MAG: hypothetical protein KJ555_08260 [Proteobacteria bacterium]|nr:hypothetical protein [Pseudomonadota bacterium]